jgi:IstB-like ATP binding protein
MGPAGIGKMFLATTLGHAAVRRRLTVHFERCDRSLKRLRASRLDTSHDTPGYTTLLTVPIGLAGDSDEQPWTGRGARSVRREQIPLQPPIPGWCTGGDAVSTAGIWCARVPSIRVSSVKTRSCLVEPSS